MSWMPPRWSPLAVRRRLFAQSPSMVRPSVHERAVIVPVSEEYEVCPVEPGPRAEVTCDVVTACHAAHLPFVGESIDSILNQAAARCWVHVVFDTEFAGQDDVIATFRDCAAVRFYRTSTRVGPYRIANEIVAHLRSDFLAIQDSDDIALPNRIWRSVTVLRETGADVFAAAMEQFVDHRHPSASARRKLESDPFHQSGVCWVLAPRGNLVNGTLVVRRQAFEALNGYADLFTDADVDFSHRAASSGVRVHVSGQIVALRRLHGASMTNDEFHAAGAKGRDSEAVVLGRQGRLDRGEVTAAGLGSLDAHLARPVLVPLTDW